MHQIETKRPALPRHPAAYTVVVEQVFDSLLNLRPQVVHVAVDRTVSLEQSFNGGDSRSDGDRMCVVGAAYQRAARGVGIVKSIHMLCLATDYGDRVAVGDRLGVIG